MTGNGDANLPAAFLLDGGRQLIRHRRMGSLGQFLLKFFLGQLGVFLGNRALCHRDNGKAAALSVPLINLCKHLLQIIGDLRNQNNVSTAGHTRIQREPSHFVAHYLYNEYPAVGRCSGMDVVNGIRGNVHRTLETERHVGSP